MIKKLLKYTLIAVVVTAALFMALTGWVGYRFRAATRDMRALPTGEVVPGVFAVNNTFCNMYLVKAGDTYIAIDAAKSADAVARGLAELKITPESVTVVLLTHSDGDHIGAVKLFKNAKVYISAAEEQMVNGKTARAFGFKKNSLPVPYSLLNDGEELDIAGVRVKGILTRGHTPGSMCYLVNGAYLFTGDTLSLKDGNVGLMSEFFNMDSKTEGQSIKMLAGLQGITHIFTDHFGYTDDFQKAMAAWK